MKNISKAIAAFQQDCPILIKESSGYGYKYASLPNIINEIKPLLKKHGLGYTHLMKGNSLITAVFHVESGEQVTSESVIELPKYYEVQDTKGGVKRKLEGFEGMNIQQAMGAIITYHKRYQLSGLLGIVTDEDTDASPKVKAGAVSKEWEVNQDEF